MRISLLAATALVLALPASAQTGSAPAAGMTGQSGSLAAPTARQVGLDAIRNQLDQAEQALTRDDWPRVTEYLERAESTLAILRPPPDRAAGEASQAEATQAINRARDAAGRRDNDTARSALVEARSLARRMREETDATGGNAPAPASAGGGPARPAMPDGGRR